MARRKRAKTERPIESYRHFDEERLNNLPVGLVTPDTDYDGRSLFPAGRAQRRLGAAGPQLQSRD